MRVRTKIAVGVTALTLLAGTTLAVVTSANAFTNTQICTSQKCLNLWNGGPEVRAYSPNVFNDNYREVLVKGRCAAGSYLTTQNCPVPGVPGGYYIVQLEETSVAHGSFSCVGDQGGLSNQADAAGFDVCNNVNTGTGGDWGTLFVVVPDSCNNNLGELMNVHWSPSFSSSRYLLATPQTNGSQVFLNVESAYCWNHSNMP